MHPRFYAARLAARLPRRTVRLRLTALYGALFLASGAGLLAITNILARSWSWPQLALDIPISPASSPMSPHPFRPPAAYLRRLQAQAAAQHAAALNQLLAESAIALGVMAVVCIALGWLVAGHVLRPLRQMTATARAISEDNLNARLAVPGPGDELKDLGDTIDALLGRLQAAFDAQRQFAASASHELRTPLTLTRTLLQTVLTDPLPTLAGYRSVCEDVLEAGERQEQLIEALLTLARSQRGLDRRDRLDLAALTRQAVDTRQAETTARGLAVTTCTVPAAPIAGDARLLERLTANLIDNAIRYNIPGGQIHIQVTTSGSQPTLRISNTGPVIPAGQIPRLLQSFQRQPATRSADQDGLGLGLAIVAAIAKAHHATLTISPGPRGGLNVATTFPPAGWAATTRQAALSPT
jgi:signal transduction histidine kinase